MNASSHSFDPSTEERAALWAARLDGSSLSAADRTELDAWLAQNPAHRVLLSQYCQFSADLEQHLPALVQSGAVSMPAIASPARSRTSRWRALWVGGFLTAAAAIAVLSLRVAPGIESHNLSTAVAQRQALTLSDGSQIELNAHTTLRVDFDRAERRVRLARGRAFFTVAKDTDRPFIVETPAGSVRVTGTRFDVHTDTASPFEVTVLDGSVQVRAGASHAPVHLNARDHLSSTGEHISVTPLSPAELADRLAWRDGRVVFADTPLRDAIAHFARHHARKITAVPAVADLRIGGRFNLDDLDGFFTALESILPVQILRDRDGSIQVAARP